MRSSRWDAQGNIYLVTEEPLTAERVRAEVGDADGILEVLRGGDDWVEIAIWNPDGSRAEMSGQRHAHRRALAGRTQRRRRRSSCASARARCAARMLGRRRASSRTSARSSSARRRRSTGVRFVAVDVGNPHAVVDGDPAEPAADRAAARDARALPAADERPGRARRRGPGEIEARVWERAWGRLRRPGSSASPSLPPSACRRP